MTALIAVAAACLSCIAIGSRVQADAPPELGWLDAYVEQGMADWRIPGLALAVVHDDRVVVAKGYGVRRLGSPERVDEHTLFGVASTTKAMTAAALALLVDEGRVSWDDPVVTFLPHFELYDPFVTRHVTIRDLLTHRTGIGRMVGNRLQFMTWAPRAELMSRLRHLGPERGFREAFVYSNMLYMVAGEVIPAVTGQSWDEFVAARLFAPLGMAGANTSVTAIGDDENAAWPHQEIDGKVRPIPRRNFDNVGPAASVNASAADMARWMRLHLGEPGVFEGRRLVSAASMREMYQPQVALTVSEPGQELAAYGLGWRLGTYRGHVIAQHGGATDGMNTNLVLVPGERLGVVVVTNTFNDFMSAVANQIIDDVLELPRRAWDAEILGAYERHKEHAASLRQRIHDAREPDAPMSVPPARYAGRFSSALYGEIAVTEGAGGLELQLWGDPDLVADLEHWHYDTFRAVWRNPAQREEFVWFDLGRDGRVDAVNVEFVLRPLLLQVGAYPSTYTRIERFARLETASP